MNKNRLIACVLFFFLFQTLFEIIWGYFYKSTFIDQHIHNYLSIYQQQNNMTGFSLGLNIWFWNTLILICYFLLCLFGLWYLNQSTKRKNQIFNLLALIPLLSLVFIDIINLIRSGTIIAFLYKNGFSFFNSWIKINKIHGLPEMLSYSIPEGYLLSKIIISSNILRNQNSTDNIYSKKEVALVFIVSEALLTIAAIIETYTITVNF
ncbi:hypothetical protein Dred_0823 [Desulforamulus reducens MI-1]|uniref:Uncharacterized protein n=1 Tax=Desulforamulus reducens (strain ATCC BAA-1160 / DSM 100696 / MI-1) TaxID=349161 RepID=A4J2Q8_DESRM|nr:stage II sporulation protein M [Desulforamulus reducens]ABO49361.1 hypothetical protein Dred_0823 [Desulforamulus reducens MI-1]